MSIEIDQSNQYIMIDADDGPLVTISRNGKVIWHQEKTFDEAANKLVATLQIAVEMRAGIRESRIEWENKIKNALIAEASKTGNITEKDLTTVIEKCIMCDRLKGLE